MHQCLGLFQLDLVFYIMRTQVALVVHQCSTTASYKGPAHACSTRLIMVVGPKVIKKDRWHAIQRPSDNRTRLPSPRSDGRRALPERLQQRVLVENGTVLRSDIAGHMLIVLLALHLVVHVVSAGRLT